MKASWGCIEAETRKKLTVLSVVMNVEEGPVKSYPLTLEKILQAQQDESSLENIPSWWVTSILLRLRLMQDTD